MSLETDNMNSYLSLDINSNFYGQPSIQSMNNQNFNSRNFNINPTETLKKKRINDRTIK
jgi:hypothetical protein